VPFESAIKPGSGHALQFGIEQFDEAALFRNHTAVAAEDLFLRKQLALFQEGEKKAARTATDYIVLAKLARFFELRSALVIVKPGTLISLHRTAFRCFWRWKSRPVGRPQVSLEIRLFIRRIATRNPTWGEERIADELSLKLQIRLSPRKRLVDAVLRHGAKGVIFSVLLGAGCVPAYFLESDVDIAQLSWPC
jgi:hypothetical protein